MSTVPRGTRVNCPFCESTTAIEDEESDSCWSCGRAIVVDGSLIDEEDVIGRPEDRQ